MNTCSCTKNQALLTTIEAALYLGVPVSYLICARSPKCPVCLVPPPKFVRLRAEKKGGKWIRYPRIELDRWLALLPLQEKKTERVKTDNENNNVTSSDKQKNCVLIMAILKDDRQNIIGSSLLKSLTAESAEDKQDK